MPTSPCLLQWNGSQLHDILELRTAIVRVEFARNLLGKHPRPPSRLGLLKDELRIMYAGLTIGEKGDYGAAAHECNRRNIHSQGAQQ